MTQERMSNLALLNTDADIVHKMDFTDITDLFAAAKTRKVCFKCFSKDLCIFGFHSHLFLNQKILLLSFQFEKILILQFSRLLHFCMSYMNTKLRFLVGPGPLISPVRQGLCGLNPALILYDVRCHQT